MDIGSMQILPSIRNQKSVVYSFGVRVSEAVTRRNHVDIGDKEPPVSSHTQIGQEKIINKKSDMGTIVKLSFLYTGVQVRPEEEHFFLGT